MKIFKPLAIVSCFFLSLQPDAYALIPADIYTNYTVSANDNGPGIPGSPVTVTIHPGAKLTINNGATVYFWGNINIMDHASLVIDSATVQMNTGGRIIVNNFSGPPSTVLQAGMLSAYNKAVLTVIPWIKTDKYWSGIESMGSTVYSNRGVVYLDHVTLSNADVGVRNYNKDIGVNGSWGGRIGISFSTLLNCRQHMAQVYNEGRLNPNDTFTNPLGGGGMNWNVMFQYVTFRHESGFQPVPFPQDMVYLNNCKGIPFYSCSFEGQLPVNNIPNTGVIGINAINSGFRAQIYFANVNVSPSKFYGLKTAISVTNALQTDRMPVIYRCDFNQCQYSVVMSGCLNPWILTTRTFGSYNGSPAGSASIPFAALSLNNCTGYKVEGNTIGYDIPNTMDYFAGIVIRNSGTANNEVYRNLIGNVKTSIGAQSLGTNKSPSNLTGLKILCNNFNSSYNNNVTVMNDLVPNGNNGIHPKQFVQGGISNSDLSAGNQFLAYGSSPAKNYYLEAGTFNAGQFLYKRNASLLQEDPTYRTPFTVQFTNGNTCPIHNTGAPQPPYPFSLYAASLQAIESQIGTIEAKSAPDSSDTLQLQYLYGRQSALVDSITTYYQQNNLPDSAILAYRQVTKGSHYPLLLAAAYATVDRYDDAMAALENLQSHYPLSIEEQEQARRLAEMYKVKQWLYLNTDNWTGLPAGYHTAVEDYAVNDPMYAGATARSLLANYENRIYDPAFRLVPQELSPMGKIVPLSADQEKIYPNPAKDRLYIDWNGDQGRLILIDAKGSLVLQQEISNSNNSIAIGKLAPGLYWAQLLVDSKIVYQQKIIKR